MNDSQSTRVGSRIVKNAMLNGVGVLSDIAVGILVVPLLLARIGEAGYGIWLLLGALAGYFQFLDFGMRGAVGRQVAFYASRGDATELNKVVSTALALLFGAASIASVCAATAALWLPQFVTIPVAYVGDARLSMLIVAINLGVFLISRVFDAVLWGFQRFDQLNLIDIPAALARLILTAAFVSSDHGLVTLALITLITTVVTGLIKAVLSFQQERALTIRVANISRTTGQHLLHFGFSQLMVSVARLSYTSVVPLVVGSSFGVQAVVPFSLASRLVEVGSRILIVSGGVLAPVATTLCSKNDVVGQRQLFRIGFRHSLLVASSLSGAMVLLGRSTIELWTGKPNLADASWYLSILAIGTLIPSAAQVSESMLTGAARIGALAALSVAHAVTGIVLVLLLSGMYDLGMICIALGVSSTLFMGIGRLWLAMRLLDLKLSTLMQSALPAVLCAALPLTMLWAVVQYHAPADIFELASYWGVFSIGAFGFGWAERRMFGEIRRRMVIADDGRV